MTEMIARCPASTNLRGGIKEGGAKMPTKKVTGKEKFDETEFEKFIKT